MNKAVECIRCHVQMEHGFVADAKQGGFMQQHWSPGEPQESFWTGLKLNSDELCLVTTLRCPTCGYLESYAAPKAYDSPIATAESRRTRRNHYNRKG